MKKLNLMALAAILPLSGFVQANAQQVPAIDYSNVSYMPGSYAPIPVAKTYFNYQPKPQPAFQATPESIAPITQMPDAPNRPEMVPVVGEDGSFTFTFGANLPSVICAPLHVCDVRLQPGEVIQQLEVGDPVRWSVKVGRSLSDNVETPHLIIKPSATSIVSNLIAITDKRTYNLQLLSKRERAWMPKVAFVYPEDAEKSWQAYFEAHPSRPSATYAANLAPSTSTRALDFNYHLKGDKPVWRPLRVYTDQAKTYIQLPAAAKNDEIPVLVLLGPGKTEQLVNYRMDGDQFIVDKVIQRATLISGVGRNQERVDIVREGS
ncbi:P-type conjugative transfer protein TrbG [Vampirovibrio sp.]|uniref:P-type conjugative transfer protein TrbG n=1 Tax=Vampirovibrio sp. TaxID=2717857 RepID=UPI0035946075